MALWARMLVLTGKKQLSINLRVQLRLRQNFCDLKVIQRVAILPGQEALQLFCWVISSNSTLVKLATSNSLLLGAPWSEVFGGSHGCVLNVT